MDIVDRARVHGMATDRSEKQDVWSVPPFGHETGALTPMPTGTIVALLAQRIRGRGAFAQNHM